MGKPFRCAISFMDSSFPSSPPNLDLLKNRDYTVVLARTATDSPMCLSEADRLWQEAQLSILTLVQQCEKLDPDGITLYVSCDPAESGCQFRKYDHVKGINLMAVLGEYYPPHEIDLQRVLSKALNDYFIRKRAGVARLNGEIILVLLDGEPRGRPEIAFAIAQASQSLDCNEELGIGLIQLGNSQAVQRFCQALDVHLQKVGAKFDIVYTTAIEAVGSSGLTTFLLNVLNH
jgi:hypothetical protein